MFRFALSPTKDLDINDLRIALYNSILSFQQGKKLYIQIEDSDTKEIIEGKDQENLEILDLLGISWSEVVYQTHNLKFHQQLATKLLMDKNAFSCFCGEDEKESPYSGRCENLSDEEVLNNEMPFSVRLRRPSRDISFEDKLKGDINFKKESIDSFVILNVDKTTTKEFATALDDMLTDISMVIQDRDKLHRTPKEILIRNYLGYDKDIEYLHISTIADAPSIKSLLKGGYLPSAIANYLILMGYKAPTKIFTLQDAKEWFDIKKLSKEDIAFNLSKLSEINRQHIRNLPPKEVAKFIGFSSSDLGELAKIYTKECSTINEIKPKIDAIFAKKDLTDEFDKLRSIAKEAPFFREYDEFKNYISNKSGLKGESLDRQLRFILTGAEKGPNLSDIYPHIKNYLGEIIR